MSKWLDKHTIKLTNTLPANWEYPPLLNIPGRLTFEEREKIANRKWMYLVDFGCNLYNTVQEVKDIIDKSYPQDRELDNHWYVMMKLRRGDHFIEDVMFKIIKTLVGVKKKVETDFVPDCVESRMYFIFKAHGEDPVLW